MTDWRKQLQYSDLPASAKLIGLAIERLCEISPDNTCSLSKKDIGKTLNLSISNITTLLSRLVNMGYIDRTFVPGKQSIYKIKE